MAESRFIFESESLETSRKFPSSLQLASQESSRKYPASLQLSRKKGLSLSRVSLDSTLSDASTNELTSALRAQQDEMQKKAFARWCNFHLVGKDKIQDLYLDFRDGVLLIKFLRCLSGKDFAKPEKGKMRIHAMQNLQACVKFLIKNDVFLDKVCTGAEDIAAGTPSNTLGMVFLIYLKFQLKGTALASKDEAGMVKALVCWAKQQTAAYSDVDVRDLAKSWQDGLLFNAIIHKNHPELIDYDEMRLRDPIDRLENAFTVAEGLGIPQLMESEDVLRYADKRSMFLYISSLYQHFSTVNTTVGQKRIKVAVRAAFNFIRDCNDYEMRAGEFMGWMDTQANLFEDTEHFKDCECEELEQLKEAHESYLEVEKQSRIDEELSLFEMYTLLLLKASASNLVPYQAPPGLIPQDIDHQFGELTGMEHSYRQKLFLRIQHLREIERLQKRFDKRANFLEERLKKYASELPANQSQDEATCNSQIKQLTSLSGYLDTFEERFTPLDNIIASLQKLDYKFIQQNIQKMEQLLSTFKSLRVAIDSKKWLFTISIEFYKPDEAFKTVSPRVNHIFDTFTQAKKQDAEIESLEEHPMFIITEIELFEETTDEKISLILEKLHTLEFIPESDELMGIYQALLDQFKSLRTKVSSTKDLVMYFLNREREQIAAVSMSADFNTLLFTVCIQEMEIIERELSGVAMPTKHEDFQGFQDKVGVLRLKSLTLQNRVNVCLPKIDGKENFDKRISAIIGACSNLEKSSLESGWMWALLDVLNDILDYLRGVNEQVGTIEKREKEVQRLSAAELNSLVEFKYEASMYQESAGSIVSGCPYDRGLLPASPDYSSHAQVKPLQQSITQILRHIQPIISHLLERQEERERDGAGGYFEGLGPDGIRKWVTKLQETAENLKLRDLDFDSLAEQGSQIRYLELCVGVLEENKFREGVAELKHLVIEKRSKKDSVSKRLLIESRINRARTYLQIKSGELDNIAINPTLQTEKYYKSLHSEMEAFQDKLSDWCERELEGLDSEYKFECTILKNEFDSVCSDLLEKLLGLMKKSGEKDKSQKLVDETAVEFISWCESPELDTAVDLTILEEDPLPTDKLEEVVTNQTFVESEFAKNKPVYEKLINDLYHSGFANGREKGKEVQKSWQVMEQNLSENAKKSGFIANCLAFLSEFSPMMSIIDRLNSEEIPKIGNEFSGRPTFEESQNLSVKIGTLADLTAFIANFVETKAQLKKLAAEAAELIGAEEANHFFTPKLTKLENGIEKATKDLDRLRQLVQCWVTFYVLDRKSALERDWAKDEIENCKVKSLSNHKIIEVTEWANNLKQNWIQTKIAPKQYQDFPEGLRSKIISSLNETNRTLDEMLVRISQQMTAIEDDQNSEEQLKGVKTFGEKLDSLENTGSFQASGDLVDAGKKISEIEGILHLLTKFRDEIRTKDPESKLLEKIPVLLKVYEDLISDLKLRQNSFKVCMDIQTHTDRISGGIECLENLTAFDTLDFEKLLKNYFQIGLLKILCLTCEKFFEELDLNPLEATEGLGLEENLSKLRDLYEELMRKISFHLNEYPTQETTLISQTKLSEAAESLEEIEFILSNNPVSRELSCLESMSASIPGCTSECNQTPELLAKQNEITEKSGELSDQIKTQKEADKLDNVDAVAYLDLVEFFKKWLEPILHEFTTVSNEKLPKFSTVSIQNYFKYILTEVAPKLYSILQEECPKGISRSEKLEGIWPIENEFIDESTEKLEYCLNSRLFVMLVEESINSIQRMSEKIPNTDNFKDDIPLAKMSPELCNASLRVAGSLCSTCSEKYQGLNSKALPSSPISTQFTAPMQSLSQAYNQLVDRCKLVVSEARAAVVRDPIVKKVKQLRRGQSQLEEMMERICSEEEPPQLFESEKEIEEKLVSHEKACNELPRILAASRDPENSLAPGDIQEVRKDVFEVSQSFDNSRNNWGQTKVKFSWRELLRTLKVKEDDVKTKHEKIDGMEAVETLDAWELWADKWIDKLTQLEIAEGEAATPRKDSLSLDSIAETEYSIGDFTTAMPSSFELNSLDLSSQFEYFGLNPLESFTEATEPSDDSPSPGFEGETSFEAKQYSLDLDSGINSPSKTVDTDQSLSSLDTPIRTRLDTLSPDRNSQDLEFEFKSALTPISQAETRTLVQTVDEKCDLKVLESNPATFDFTKLAFDVVSSQESIDGDPARPSPVHRVLDVGDSRDGDEFVRNIIDIMMSEEGGYVGRENEFEGKEIVEEVFELKEQPVVESGFNFDTLFDDVNSVTDDNTSIDTVDSERQGRAGKNGSKKRRHVSFTREDVVIAVKTVPVTHDVIVSGRNLIKQGSLSRKQELLSESRKPIKRQWKDMFIVVKLGRLEFYKDPIEMTVGNSLSPELALPGGLCEVPSDYTKKEFVFRIKCANGSSFLFQTSDSKSLCEWMSAINQSIILSTQQVGGYRVLTRHQSLDTAPQRFSDDIDADLILERDGEEGRIKSKLPKFFKK